MFARSVARGSRRTKRGIQIPKLRSNQSAVIVSYRRSAVQLLRQQSRCKSSADCDDRHRSSTGPSFNLAPDASPNIRHEFCRTVRGHAINCFLFDQTIKTGVTQQANSKPAPAPRSHVPALPPVQCDGECQASTPMSAWQTRCRSRNGPLLPDVRAERS